ncbi:MAG: hypothetical protein A2X49_06470 [Lentisphaerae bacterium GWF2_52_8]|nr:MAG: hypothetical protein A2X49_06470 [Lentisphaerae bacterium GWF2_52_8]
MIKIVQCWDDGVTEDARLADILRKHGAKATFNINPGLYKKEERCFGWKNGAQEILRLSLNELPELYRGFDVAGHSMTHPHLETLSAEKIRWELVECRRVIEELFKRPVRGFAYPFGSWNELVKEELRKAGYVYARTTKNVSAVFPPEDPMEFHPSCHFLSPKFMDEFERVKKEGGVFYFWGHSYEMREEHMWVDFERKIEYLSSAPEAQWCNIIDLFEA